MNRRDLEMHLQDLFEGRLEDEALQDLQQELRSNPDAKDAYRDYAHLQNVLQLRADGIDLLHVVPMDRVIKRRERRHLRSALLSAAAMLLVAGLVAALIVINQPEPRQLTAVATADTKWTVDGAVQDPTEDEWTVTAGSTVQVWSGTIRLNLGSGATMVVQGPAHVSFPELDKPVLKIGWLWIDSGESSEPFEVHTSGLLIYDIGTRFGVRVSEQGPPEVHLIEGKVEVFTKSTQKKIAILEPEGRGIAFPAIGEPKRLPLARDPFPELADLLTTPANYTTTVRGQNPAGYWRVEETEAKALTNEVPEGLVGHRHASVTTGEPGPGPADGFLGFGEDNHAALLLGKPNRVPISLGATPVHTGVLFRDDFNGNGSDLHGATPEVTTSGANWVAASVFGRDGSIKPNAGSATLAFTPVDGIIYTLDASLTTAAGPSDDWIALGFARGQSAEKNTRARFTGSTVVGRAWMLHRAQDSTHPINRAWISTEGADWSWPGSSPLGGPMDLRIVLDTTKGPGHWTATWYAKRPAEDSYTTVREAMPLINEMITSIGLSVSGDGISGTIESFSLRAERKGSFGSDQHSADAPARVARKEGTVSLWMRREPAGARQEILWAAGEHPADDSIHAHLTADGRAGFFMENGRYDVLLVSEETIDDGEWHHLTSSWSPSTVDLYLDGKRVARDSEFRGKQLGILPELRFGGGPAGSKAAPFTGWVDEIALWDRALTPAEVSHQFDSAVGQQPQ